MTIHSPTRSDPTTAPPGPDVAITSSGGVLDRAVDALLTLPYRPWHFGDSVAFEAMVAAGPHRPDAAAFARGFIRAWAAALEQHQPLDCTAPGSTFCRLYELTADEHLLTAAVDLATYLRTRRRLSGIHLTWERSPLRRPYGDQGLSAEEEALLADPGPGVFLDCLHFEPPLFAALWTATAERRWQEAAVGQAEAYVTTLQDPDGLFHHFLLERTGRRYGKGWGRGQGWALLGLLDVLERLPRDQTTSLRTATASLCRALAQWQRSDGQFDAVVNDPASGVETSTAAFVAAGFPRAADLGLDTAVDLRAVAARAYEATLQATDEQGVLSGVSAEVFASTSLDHYRHVPRGFVVPWGQGPLVLALLSHRDDR